MKHLDDKPLHEILRLHAKQNPDKTAIIWYGAAITYGELDSLSDKCAAWLSTLGVCKGEPVALFMQNCPQYVIAHFGIQKLGAIASPCSPLFKQHELNYQLQDQGARVILAADALYPIVKQSLDDTLIEHIGLVHYADCLPSTPSYSVPEEILVPRTIPNDTLDLMAELNRLSTKAPLVATSMDDVALLVYTSGTTGRPKGAMLTYANALFKTAGGVETGGIKPHDIHLVIPPLYHISGMLCGINIPIYLGATAVLHYRFSPVATLESITCHKPTYWKGIAPMLQALMDCPDAGQYDLSSLRLCPATSFGIRTTPELAARWAAFTGGAQAYEAGYGLTETHTFDSVMPPEAVRWGTNGRLLPGAECRIINAVTNKEVDCAGSGEVFLKSPGNFRGYWKQPEKTAETLLDSWVRTGDIGTVDADGYLTLLGRSKEMIKVSGYSVFPEDVEAILLRHPDLAQAAVIGVSDPSKGEVVKAILVARTNNGPALTSDELVRWCKENMSAYKVPRIVEFRDNLPMTASGKVQRHLLQ
ncbi:MAG TPA: AMP-binding protein [Candidimonas sp.]|nr:AMP-binding protein [Candidimonas sp.]